jgi:hypothetical protein
MKMRRLFGSLALLAAFAAEAQAIDYPYRSFEQMYGQRAGFLDYGFDFNQGNFAFKSGIGGLWPPFTIYSTHSGSLQVVAETGTPVPPVYPGFGEAQLTDTGTPSLDGQSVVFRGGHSFGTGYTDGMYRNTNGSWVVIGDWNTPLPWGAYPDSFGEPVARGGAVAFATWAGPQGGGIAIERNGTTELLVNALPTDLSIAYPPDTRIAFDGQHAAFVGYSSQFSPKGVYRDDGSGATLIVADIDTAIPGGTGNFTWFGLPAIDDGRVAFVGQDVNGRQGIYTDWTGTLERIVDTNTPVPGGGQFLELAWRNAPGFDDGRIAFLARILDIDLQEKFAIFTNATGQLTRLLTDQDAFDNDHGWASLFQYPNVASHVHLSGKEIAFNTFNDWGVADIYVITVPEPSTFLLAFLSAAVLVVFGGTRHRKLVTRSAK